MLSSTLLFPHYLTYIQTPVVEPQNKQEFVAAMHLFQEKVKDPAKHGAVFFAVCRGKVHK
jgi:hypothetical protein